MSKNEKVINKKLVDDREELIESATEQKQKAAKERQSNPEDKKCADVDKFDSKHHKLTSFFNRFDNYFELKPRSYPLDADESRIRYVSTRLTHALVLRTGPGCCAEACLDYTLARIKQCGTTCGPTRQFVSDRWACDTMRFANSTQFN